WGLLKTSLLGEILLIGIVGNRFRSQKDLAQVGWWTLGLSTLLLLATVVVYLYVFPYPAASRVSFPLLEISRVIVTGRWLQRVETIFLIIWVLAGALKLMAGLYGAAKALGQVMQLATTRLLVMPLAALAYSLAFLPSSLPEAVQWDANLLRNYGWVISLALPGLTWLVSAVKTGDGEKHVA
ncbi:MAG: GerAB/ArcD/ProY family transporter, partial [Bacillota bacterium]